MTNKCHSCGIEVSLDSGFWDGGIGVGVYCLPCEKKLFDHDPDDNPMDDEPDGLTGEDILDRGRYDRPYPRRSGSNDS